MSGYDNVPYNGYKVEDNALFYINNDCDSKEFNQGDEIKVTLKDNKYTLTKTGKTYKGNAGIKLSTKQLIKPINIVKIQ